MEKKEHERRRSLAKQEAAKAWCGEKTSGKTMDVDLAEEFAKILVVPMYEPHLGCASTEELIEEIKARLRIEGLLSYKTIESD